MKGVKIRLRETLRVKSTPADLAIEAVASPGLAELERLSEAAAALLRSLANPIRLRILCLLVEGELAVGVIASRLLLREALVSQHLMRLRLEGILRFRRQGTSVFYCIASEPAAAVLQTLYAYFCGPGSRGGIPDAADIDAA